MANETLEIRFELTDGYYIRKMNEYNWVVAKEMEIKEGENIGEKWEKIVSYCATFQDAWDSAVDILPRLAEDKKKIFKLVQDLKSLKFSINSKVGLIPTQR